MSENKGFYRTASLCMQGELHSLAQPQIMGILNINPHSFFDGGQYTEVAAAVERCGVMLAEGADCIDIGAASSKPGSPLIEAKEEWRLLEPFLKALRESYPHAIFSIDTYHAATAEKAVHAGAQIINDISGGELDPRMPEVMASLAVPYVLMHMQGKPATMQQDPQYPHSVERSVQLFFSRQLDRFRDAGVADIILDPGFCFGKTLAHNYQLFQALPALIAVHGCPILVGISRKSMVNKVLETSAQEALNGSTVLHALALEKGAHFLRCHDVKEAVEVRKILTFTKKYA